MKIVKCAFCLCLKFKNKPYKSYINKANELIHMDTISVPDMHV